MSFYTLIENDDGHADAPSDLFAIGNAIKDLSLHAGDALTLPIHQMPSIALEDVIASGDPVISAAGTDICNALAITKVERNTAGVWSKGETISKGSCDSLNENIKVKFVFEAEDEIVIAVPHQSVLEYGLDNAPMGEPEYISRTVGDMQVLAARIDEAIIDKLGDDTANDVRPLIQDELDKLREETAAAAKDSNVFFEQLGSYPIRQCG